MHGWPPAWVIDSTSMVHSPRRVKACHTLHRAASGIPALITRCQHAPIVYP